MNLADNLKKIRKEHNLSQEQLAEQLGVSRQSVSKWESGQAYPEMDKVLQLAKMFNLNIDDLLNQDIKEVNSEKQSKIVINKYIEDFFSFITKTIDMFSSMKFMNKLKCFFEQFVIICLLIVLFLIIGSIGHVALSGILSIFPQHIIYSIESICSSIYLVIALILGIILLIHIFKVRYLDYYVIVKGDLSLESDKSEDNCIKDENNKKDKKIYLEKKKEKIIIRDPKHTEYRFLSGMLKCLLFFIRGFVLVVAFMFCASLIGLVLSLVVSFLIVKTGLFFLGIFISLLACIVVNIVILLILFNFIMGKKVKKKYLLSTFITSVVLFGVGAGLGVIGFTSFDYIDDIENDIYMENEFFVPMQDDLIIHGGGVDIKFVEEDRNDMRMVFKHTKYYESYMNRYQSDTHRLYLGFINSDGNFLDFARRQIKDINDKKIIDYRKHTICIYTSKENIETLQKNREDYLWQSRNL